MTSPNSFSDHSADDPFERPTSDGDSPIGASPAAPHAISDPRAGSKRRNIFLIGGGVGVLLVVMFMASGHSSGPTKTTAHMRGQIDSSARARSSAPRNTSSTLTERKAVDMTARAPEGGPSLVDPTKLGAPPVTASGRAGALTGPVPDGTDAGASYFQNRPITTTDPNMVGVPAQGTATALPATAQNPFGPAPTGAAGEGATSALSATEQRRQASLDAARAAEERTTATQKARAEFIKTEEERLKKGSTLIAEGKNVQDVGHAAPPAGTSRFGDPAIDAGATPADGAAESAETAPVAGGVAVAGAMAAAKATGNKYGILPGTRVQAVTTTEYVSDKTSGDIEVRLTSALRTKTNVVLPSGTRAFGTIASSGGTPGKPARAVVTVNVFLTPDGRVIRDLSAKAADPTTLAFSVPASVDHQYLQRALRGLAGSAVDLAIAKHGDQSSGLCVPGPNGVVCSQPSPTNQAIDQARAKAGAIISGDVGNETSVGPTITLPQGTPLVLVFGL